MSCVALFTKSGNKPLVFIVPDDKHASMWRMLSPDGHLSDMANISRIKDAAKAIALRKLSTATTVVSSHRLHWKMVDDPR